MSRASRIPSYRLHKNSGQAIVTIPLSGGGRRDVYLGEYNSPDSRREYSRIIAELVAAAVPEQVEAATACGSANPNVTVDEILLAFWRFAERHYRRADGSATNELTQYKQTFKLLRSNYGHTRAWDFGPLALKTLRQCMIDLGWCRRLVNQRVGRVRRVFKWAVENELIPVAVHQALATVAGLQRGRTEAPDCPPVAPVAVEHVRATLPHLRPEVAAMVEVQLLTGVRPGELCQLRPVDIDTSGPVWHFRPVQFKTLHRGKSRVVAIGPKAQAILARFTPEKPTAYYFSPARAVENLHAERSARRRTPRFVSHMTRNQVKRVAVRRRGPAARYNATSYGHAVARAIEKANRPLVEAGVELDHHVPHWTPNQLRHTHATQVRKRFGLEAAQVALGHERADVTQVYAEKNLALASMVAAEMG